MSTTIDWQAAEHVAAGLGIHTRRLVASRDPSAVRKWALEMAEEHAPPAKTPTRVASYLELAALVSEDSAAEEPASDQNERSLSDAPR